MHANLTALGRAQGDVTLEVGRFNRFFFFFARLEVGCDILK